MEKIIKNFAEKIYQLDKNGELFNELQTLSKKYPDEELLNYIINKGIEKIAEENL